MVKLSRNFKIFLVIIVLILALVIRLFLVSQKGYPPDIDCFQDWSRSATLEGLTNIYKLYNHLVWPNYLPLYLYVLHFIGLIYQRFFSASFELNTPSLITLLKLPAIIFDFLVAFLIFFILKKKTKFAFLISSLFLLNPGIFYLSSYWGQVDSIFTFFVLCSIFLLAQKNFPLSWIFITIATFVKLQSLIFIPLIFFLNLEQAKKIQELVRGIFLALIVAFLISFPYLLTGKIFYLFRIVFQSIESYPYLSLNAFNLWWLFNGDKLVIEKFFGLISYLTLGLSLFGLSYFFITRFALKEPSSERIYLAASFISLSFFLLAPSMHERYLFPFFALFALIIYLNKKLFLLYLLFSLTFFFNLLAVAPIFNSQIIFNLSLQSSYPIAIFNLILFLYFIYHLIVIQKKLEIYGFNHSSNLQ